MNKWTVIPQHKSFVKYAKQGDTKGFHIQSFNIFEKGNHIEISESNAALIAAAPELYEALKTIASVERMDNIYDKSDMEGVIKIAKQAIAKAEGRDNA